MPTCLAIIAHEKAAPTIADFEPQWRKLGLPILAFLPEGDKWPGGEVERVYNYGESAHRGVPVYLRFVNVLLELLRTQYDEYIIAEYDTANLTAALPASTPNHLSSAFCSTFGPDVEKVTGHRTYYISLSPWCLDRAIARRLLFAMWQRLDFPKHEEWVGGYLDRWIASVALEAAIPCAKLPNAIGWTHGIEDIHAKARAMQATWIHGWKSKADFKDLWPIAQ